jgi:ATP-dependent helicase Lhr and Lhr-like helicase
MVSDPLLRFDPLTAEWFSRRFGAATDIQVQAWQAIAHGEHLLMAAPTGSGKTLAAFLWALDRLIAGAWPLGATRVLYVSPLKALNNDIRRNLLVPLQELKALFERRSRDFPEIQVRTRSGDTAPAERRRLLRRPPEILITTPESLNLMLSSAGGLSTLGSLRTVILDEIHAVLASRRGTLLITAVERLTRLSGEFQRIALSATLNPMESAARFVGGSRCEGPPDSPRYVPRAVTAITAPSGKEYALSIHQPDLAAAGEEGRDYWLPFAEAITARIQANRATLIFTNSRRLCEKLTFLINHNAPGQEQGLLAYAHHGSLSREIRAEVEKNLKAGALRAIVATSSLELGIDIGALDEVVLVQSPPTVAETVQRVGRAGHGVGQISRGAFYPSHVLDLVSAAVLVRAVSEESIEVLRPVRAPLDVLAQVILSMTALETWHCDDLFNFMRTAWPYRQLSRRQFDLVLSMLAGRYGQGRIRELQPRIHYDRIDGTVRGGSGVLLALYASGGVIPDRGYYGLRHGQSGARIGELDEEFVWEARIGQVFTLGTQNWRIQKITASDVLVVPAPHARSAPPFWKAEAADRDFHLADKLGRWLEWAEGRLSDPAFVGELVGEYHLDRSAAQHLADQLLRQRELTGCALPHRHHLVIESTHLGAGGGRLVVLHTLWGGRVNRPLAMALEAAMEERNGSAPQIFAANESIAMLLPPDVPVETIMALVSVERVEELIRRRLPQTGYFGARFRECAGRALLLPRRRINVRTPLWLSRLRAHKLLEAVSGSPDFPILLETWRTCLQDEFDLVTLKQLLGELADGTIAWSGTQTPFPTPMARSSAWQPVNTFMYLGDAPAGAHPSGLSEDLYREIALEPRLRPQLDPAVVTEFETKRQRLAAGYAPDSAGELLEWLKERLAIPLPEWRTLLAAMARDHGLLEADLAAALAGKALLLHCGPLCREPLVMAAEMLPRWKTSFCDPTYPFQATGLTGEPMVVDRPAPSLVPDCEEEDDSPASGWIGEWLRFYGPRSQSEIAALLGLSPERLGTLVAPLLEDQHAISGRLVAGGAADAVCDRENFEILLRLARQASAPQVAPLAAERLPLFLAEHQGVIHQGDSMEALAERLNQLLTLPAPAALWETEILPARLADYRTEWLDHLMQEGQLRWIGSPGRKVLFCLESDLDLIGPLREEAKAGGVKVADTSGDDDMTTLFPDPWARYPFAALQQQRSLSADELNARLWRAVWQGQVSNDTFAALRRGLDSGFKIAAAAAPPTSAAAGRRGLRRRAGQGAFQRWRSTRPVVGNWFRLPVPPSPQDLIEAEEADKERVRLLLERYGILFRELLQRELPALRWSVLFRTLRRMELSGEVLAGHFFEGIAGLQFITPQMVPVLLRPQPEEAVFWLNAADPASLCGSGIAPLTQLPRRVSGTHLVYHGTSLVVVSHQQARHLSIRVAADHPQLKAYFGFLVHLLTRAVSPLRRIVIQTINDTPSGVQEDYVVVLKEIFETLVDYKGVTLYRRH